VKPAVAFSAGLLSLLAMLMASHLWMLQVGLRECDDLFRVQLEQVKRLSKVQAKQGNIEPLNPECTNIEDEFHRTAELYLAVILAILGGQHLGDPR
jgi:hypothetical protein